MDRNIEKYELFPELEVFETALASMDDFFRRKEVEIRLFQQYHLTLIVSLFIYDFNDRNSFVIFGFSLVFIYTFLGKLQKRLKNCIKFYNFS